MASVMIIHAAPCSFGICQPCLLRIPSKAVLISIQVSNFRVTPSDYLSLGDGSDGTGVGTHRLDISKMIWHLTTGAASAAGPRGNQLCTHHKNQSRMSQSATPHHQTSVLSQCSEDEALAVPLTGRILSCPCGHNARDATADLE